MGHVQEAEDYSDLLEYSHDEFLRDHAAFMQSISSKSDASGSALQAKVSELESEVTKLREQLGKAKGINDMMWEKFVQKTVTENREATTSSNKPDQRVSEADVEMMAENESRKRQRT